MDDLSREDVATVIERLIAEALSTAGVTVPPVDALAVASRFDVSVEIDRTASEEVNQWTAARAVGDHFKKQLREQLGVERGSLSTPFATALLLPMQWFRKDVREYHFDLLQLKDRYRTAAMETIAFRLLDLGEPCIITIADADKVHRRRSNGPHVKKQLDKPEQDCLRLVNESGQPQTVSADGWTVHGWPAPLDGWQRVILRSIVELD
jgi:hypothetical protein